MTQATQTDYEEEEAQRRGQVAQTTQVPRTEAPAIPPEMKVAYTIVTIAVLLIISVVILTGSTWAFAFIYVPTAIVYIAGALYLFKRLMEYRPTRH
jgi:ABC-type xylose transport system permease subunit